MINGNSNKHPPSRGADDVEDACRVPRNVEQFVYVTEDATGGKRHNNKLPNYWLGVAALRYFVFFLPMAVGSSL